LISPIRALVVGLQAGRTEIVADKISHVIKNTLTSDPSRYAAILGG